MKVLVNALSVTNVSGRHVLLGHLAQLAGWTVDRHHFIVIYHAVNKDIRCDLGPNVDWVECPALTAHWLGRGFWELVFLPRLARKHGADLVFTPAGVAVPGLSVPQVVFAQNPWCLVPELPRRPFEQVKAFLQRRAYKKTMHQAALMIFNSHYMHDAYRLNADFEARLSSVCYQAIAPETHQAALAWRKNQKRNPHQVVSVSAMAPHKGVETLVQALALVRRTYQVPATLILVGAWPDKKYARTIHHLVQGLKLGDSVSFKGHVSTDNLHRYYAESKVFILMSRCESFGIPAVEAQAFGTPVVSSNCCAIPEVCGQGGIYPEPGDAEGTAEALASLLIDKDRWERLSQGAIQNATRYHWEACSRPLLKIFEVVGEEQ